MLTLPIKKKWFDMILSGEKKEEYREIKPYYDSRFKYIGPDICIKSFLEMVTVRIVQLLNAAVLFTKDVVTQIGELFQIKNIMF